MNESFRTLGALRSKWLSRFRAAGIRPTSLRVGVLQILAEDQDQWLRTKDVLRRMMERGWATSQSGVYRSAQTLARAGLLEQRWSRGPGSPRVVYHCRSVAGTAQISAPESLNPYRRTAWALFCRMRDAPSAASAEELVRWLGEDARNVRALDDALTLWALAGYVLVEPSLDEGLCRNGTLQ